MKQKTRQPNNKTQDNDDQRNDEQMDERGREQRIDKWLWAARFYKTRALAVEAIKKGKISVNGVRPKPARCIHINDEIIVRREPFEYLLTVKGVNEQRRPAKEASALYEESEASQLKRQQLANELAVMRDAYQPSVAKPDRRQRDALRKLRRGQ